MSANHYDRPIRNREQQWDRIRCTVLWQVLGFAVPFTSLSKLYKNVGPNHFFWTKPVFWLSLQRAFKICNIPCESCLAGITFFEMAAFISHLCSMIPGGYHGKKKACEVFVHGIDLGHGLYLSHKDLGRESFHKRTCNFVQGGLHVKVSCAYGGNLPCVRHTFNCCKLPLYVGQIPSVGTLPYT
jgi:hypothetical protein